MGMSMIIFSFRIYTLVQSRGEVPLLMSKIGKFQLLLLFFATICYPDWNLLKMRRGSVSHP